MHSSVTRSWARFHCAALLAGICLYTASSVALADLPPFEPLTFDPITFDPLIYDEQQRIGSAEPMTLDGRLLSARHRGGPTRTWELTSTDKTLQSVIARWSTAAGWQMLWELSVDYPIATQASITGTFEEAIETITKTMEKAEIPIRVIFYEGNKVVRVVAKGVE